MRRWWRVEVTVQLEEVEVAEKVGVVVVEAVVEKEQVGVVE